MKMAHIENGLVVNVIVVDPESVPDWCHDWPVCEDVGPGYTWDGSNFHPPVYEEQEN